MKHVLRLHDVHKKFGATKALDGLSFSIPKGAICGVIGANGAGKTTLYSILGGYIPFDSGQVDILGSGPFNIDAHKGRISILPQDSALNPDLPIKDILLYFARLQGLTRSQALLDVERVLKAVDLHDRARFKIHQLSHGMRRRVSVAQALLGSPELILLDEPSAGLDPKQTARLQSIFRNKPQNSTLLISSHILSELEEVCDYVVFMEKGRCIEHGSLFDLTDKRSTVQISFEGTLNLVDVQNRVSDISLSIEGGILIAKGLKNQSIAELNQSILPILLDLKTNIIEIQRGYTLSERFKNKSTPQKTR